MSLKPSGGSGGNARLSKKPQESSGGKKTKLLRMLVVFSEIRVGDICHQTSLHQHSTLTKDVSGVSHYFQLNLCIWFSKLFSKSSKFD